MDPPGAVTLYFRGPGEAYTDAASITVPVTSSPGDIDLDFTIDRDPGSVAALRLNFRAGAKPIDADYIKLYSVSVRALNGSESTQALIDINDVSGFEQQAAVHGLRLDPALLGGTHVVEHTDPSVEFELPGPASAGSGTGLKVRACFEYLPSFEYILARDRFLLDQERMELERRDLESRLAASDKARDSLRAYQESPLWHTFTRADRYWRGAARLWSNGPMGALAKLLNPGWWSRRKRTDYEKWRTARGYRNRGDG